MYSNIWYGHSGEAGLLKGEKLIRKWLRLVNGGKGYGRRSRSQGPELKRGHGMFVNIVCSVCEPLMNLQA